MTGKSRYIDLRVWETGFSEKEGDGVNPVETSPTALSQKKNYLTICGNPKIAPSYFSAFHIPHSLSLELLAFEITSKGTKRK